MSESKKDLDPRLRSVGAVSSGDTIFVVVELGGIYSWHQAVITRLGRSPTSRIQPAVRQTGTSGQRRNQGERGGGRVPGPLYLGVLHRLVAYLLAPLPLIRGAFTPCRISWARLCRWPVVPWRALFCARVGDSALPGPRRRGQFEEATKAGIRHVTAPAHPSWVTRGTGQR